MIAIVWEKLLSLLLSPTKISMRGLSQTFWKTRNTVPKAHWLANRVGKKQCNVRNLRRQLWRKLMIKQTIFVSLLCSLWGICLLSTDFLKKFNGIRCPLTQDLYLRWNEEAIWIFHLRGPLIVSWLCHHIKVHHRKEYSESWEHRNSKRTHPQLFFEPNHTYVGIYHVFKKHTKMGQSGMYKYHLFKRRCHRWHN